MHRQFHRFPLCGLIFATFAWGLTTALHADSLRIVKVEPTPLFPKAKAGEPLRQIVRLSLKNPGAATEAKVKIALPERPRMKNRSDSIAPGRVDEGYSRSGDQPADGIDRRTVRGKTRGNRPT